MARTVAQVTYSSTTNGVHSDEASGHPEDSVHTYPTFLAGVHRAAVEDIIEDLVTFLTSAGVDARFMPRLRNDLQTMGVDMPVDEFAQVVALLRSDFEEGVRLMNMHGRLYHLAYVVMEHPLAMFRVLCYGVYDIVRAEIRRLLML
ncbi:unnamed protein product [Peniophora sp. CBMAI 1063]|nr:unnamed protein product [Peniophora sp. CBMAI 1063]